MAEKRTWLFICKNGENNIFTGISKRRPGNPKRLFSVLLLLISASWVMGQTFSREQILFTLFDKSGKQFTDAAIKAGQVRVYSLREPKTITHSHLNFDHSSKYFTFAESAISPGMLLAFVTATDTMYVSFYGRSANRTIDGIKVQKGSYVLTSGEFAGQKLLQVKNWNKYLEEELAPAQQDLTAYRAMFKNKKPIGLVNHPH